MIYERDDAAFESSVTVISTKSALVSASDSGCQKSLLDSKDTRVKGDSVSTENDLKRKSKNTAENPPLVILEEVFTPDYNVTEEEVAEYARSLGIETPLDPDLFSLAKKALLAPLPRTWTPVKDKEKGVYYFNRETGESSWTHPVDASLKEFLKFQRREKDFADTDSCVDNIITDEDFSHYFKDGQTAFNTGERETVLSDSDSNQLGSDQISPEDSKGSLHQENTMNRKSALPPVGKKLPTITSQLKNVIPPLTGADDLRQSLSSSNTSGPKNHLDPPSFTSSPSSHPPQENLLKSTLDLALSSTLTKTSNLRPILKQPQGSDRLSVASDFPDKNLRFNIDVIQEYNSSEKEREIKDELPLKNQNIPLKNSFSQIKLESLKHMTAPLGTSTTDSDQSSLVKTSSHQVSEPPASELKQEKHSSEPPKTLSKESEPSKSPSRQNTMVSKPQDKVYQAKSTSGNAKPKYESAESLTLEKTNANKPNGPSPAGSTKAVETTQATSVSTTATTTTKTSVPIQKNAVSRVPTGTVSTSSKVTPSSLIQTGGPKVTAAATKASVSAEKTSTVPTGSTSNSTSKSVVPSPSLSVNKKENPKQTLGKNPEITKTIPKPKTSITDTSEISASTPDKSKTTLAKVTSESPIIKKALSPQQTSTTTTNKSVAKTIPHTSMNVQEVKLPLGTSSGKSNQSANTLVSQPNEVVRNKGPENQLELEQVSRQKKTNQMGRVVAKFNKFSEEPQKPLENDDSSRSSKQPPKENEATQTDASKSTQTSQINFLGDGARAFATFDHDIPLLVSSFHDVKHSFYRLEEDFLAEKEESILRELSAARDIHRKRATVLHEASLSVERGMRELLQEQQNELRQKYRRSIDLMKRDLELSLDKSRRETQNLEVKKNEEQNLRITYLQNAQDLELEMIQASHRNFMNNLQRENDKEIENMKQEINQLINMQKANSEKIIIENQRKIIDVCKNNSNDIPTHTSETEENFSRINKRADSRDTLLAEFEKLRKEIKDSKDKTQTNSDPSPISVCTNHKCTYGSKYERIKRRYLKLIKQIQHEKSKKRNLAIKSISSSPSSDSSDGRRNETKEFFDAVSDDRSTLSTLSESSMVKLNLNLSDKLNSVNIEDNEDLNDFKFPGSLQWPNNDSLLKEGKKILAQTLKFLNTNKVPDDQNEILESEENFEFDSLSKIKEIDTFETSPDHSQFQDEFDDRSLASPGKNKYYDMSTSEKSELDLILERIASKPDKNDLLPLPETQNVYTRNHREQTEKINNRLIFKPSEDMQMMNEILRNKWRSYFGDSSVPLKGKVGWPTMHLTNILPADAAIQKTGQFPLLYGRNTSDIDNISSNAGAIRQRIENIRSWLNEKSIAPKNFES